MSARLHFINPDKIYAEVIASEEKTVNLNGLRCLGIQNLLTASIAVEVRFAKRTTEKAEFEKAEVLLPTRELIGLQQLFLPVEPAGNLGKNDNLSILDFLPNGTLFVAIYSIRTVGKPGPARKGHAKTHKRVRSRSPQAMLVVKCVDEPVKVK